MKLNNLSYSGSLDLKTMCELFQKAFPFSLGGSDYKVYLTLLMFNLHCLNTGSEPKISLRAIGEMALVSGVPNVCYSIKRLKKWGLVTVVNPKGIGKIKSYFTDVLLEK